MTPATVPALQRRNAQLEAKIEELKEELEFERRESRLRAHTDAEAALQVRYKLPPLNARLLYLMYLRRGRPLAVESAMEAMYPREIDRPEDKVISVLICRMRRVMGPEAIQTLHGTGYRLHPAIVREIDTLLRVEKPGPIHKMGPADAMPPRKPREANLRLKTMTRMAQGPVTAAELANHLRWQTHQAYAHLSALRHSGLAEPTGDMRRGRTLYGLTDAGRAWVAARQEAK